MPNDPRPELHILAPDLTADEVRELADRAMADAEEERAKSFDRTRKAHGLLKRVDEILARR